MTSTFAPLSSRSVSGRSWRRSIPRPRQKMAMERPTWNEPVTGCPWWDKDRLSELLTEQGLTYTDAAAELGCHPETVKKWASRYGVVREANA